MVKLHTFKQWYNIKQHITTYVVQYKRAGNWGLRNSGWKAGKKTKTDIGMFSVQIRCRAAATAAACGRGLSFKSLGQEQLLTSNLACMPPLVLRRRACANEQRDNQ